MFCFHLINKSLPDLLFLLATYPTNLVIGQTSMLPTAQKEGEYGTNNIKQVSILFLLVSIRTKCYYQIMF